MYTFLLNQKTSLLKNTIWYSLGSFCYSFSSFFLLISVSRILGGNDLGVFSIGWAICQLSYAIGLFGLRNFQVSEGNRSFSFYDYIYSKMITIPLMLIGMLCYCWFLGVSTEKLTVAFLLTLLMVSEVLADLFSGYFQTIDKLMIAGQSYVLRIVAYDFLFVSSLVITKNLSFSLVVTVFFSFIWLLFVDYQLIKKINLTIVRYDLSKVKHILMSCFPIFISAFLINFIFNIPKNNIEIYSTNQIQAIYNVLSMPSAVITLMASFIVIPLYTNITNLWLDKKMTEFKKSLYKISFFILAFTLMIVLLGYVFGLQVMSILFGMDLSEYMTEFLILLLAGGMNSLINFFVFILTVFRVQKFLIYIYVVVAATAYLYTPFLVKYYTVFGGAISYLISVSIITILLIVVIVFFAKKNKRVG